MSDQVPPRPSSPPVSVPDLQAELESLAAENLGLKQQLHSRSTDLVELNDQEVLQDVGIYRYHHPLESAAAYKERLREIESQIAALVKSKRAITRSELFTFNNSLAQGKKLSSDLGRLMLRAYNAEADNVIRSLRAGNLRTALRRLEATRNAITKLGALMEMQIGDQYHDLRVHEVELTADWLMKKQEEREEAREERQRLREERKVQQELEEERKRLDKEKTHLTNTLRILQEQGQADDALNERLAVIDEAIEHNDFRAANIRAGYIYVISNEGAFGRGVVKIGLTRRLEPSERISELSGASVPFRFDTHTLFFSEDAVTLENELHKLFADRALNQANPRKEFFFATPEEVRLVLMERVGNMLEFTDTAEAAEFRQSWSKWPARPRELRG
ncbi:MULTISPECIES: DUF4041 domain-containing protein [unclassified Brevibacterium]|uniref:DUF4041 domain-containing protein n=1 Tax=unclassified Brevibacterium TaxID=2614124 RepID=UPI001E5D8EA5|nr:MULTISPECIES: DUF4041 domain-containing protein [unclassified Brevibacterium]MDK8433383.1 DUF4041 domain-containing protein [Brevibacterium sp. H-BE7]